MNEWVVEKEVNSVVAYVVGRFLQAGVDYFLLLAATRTLTFEFGVKSEEEAEKLVKKYLESRGELLITRKQEKINQVQ